MLILIGFGAVLMFAFGILFMLAGGWLHHRGVLAGKGANDNFIGQPTGEVFRIPMPDDMEAEPEENEHLTKLMGRVESFKSRMSGS